MYVFDPGFETDTYYHEGDTEFIYPVRLKRNLMPGTHAIIVDVFYMVCNARLCYPPLTKTDTVWVEVEAGAPRSDRTSFMVAAAASKDGPGKGKNTLL